MLALCLALSARAALANSGSAYVTSFPTGADVWVDGTYIGRTPILAGALALGHHRVTLTKTGASSRELDVDVPASGVAAASAYLAPAPNAHDPNAAGASGAGAYILHGVPSGARVLVDGEPVNATRAAAKLSAGAHTVDVASNSKRIARSFIVYPRTTTDVVLTVNGGGRSSVVAPVEDFLPENAYSLQERNFLVRYEGHVVSGQIGVGRVRYDSLTVTYDSVPKLIGGKLYLPLELLEKLTVANKPK